MVSRQLRRWNDQLQERDNSNMQRRAPMVLGKGSGTNLASERRRDMFALIIIQRVSITLCKSILLDCNFFQYISDCALGAISHMSPASQVSIALQISGHLMASSGDSAVIQASRTLYSTPPL